MLTSSRQEKIKLVFQGIAIVVAGYIIVFVLAAIIPPFWAKVFFGGDIYEKPINFHMGMWLPFFLACGSLWRTWANQKKMLAHLSGEPIFRGEPDEIMDAKGLGEILKRIRDTADEPSAVAKKIIQHVIWKYQTAKSSDQASGMLSSLVDICAHRLDLQYAFIRYISWFIPSLGFMGTIFGISTTIGIVGVSRPDDPALLQNIARSLTGAFDATFVALGQTSFLIFLMNRLELKDESFVNYLNRYVQEKLINRLE